MIVVDVNGLIILPKTDGFVKGTRVEEVWGLMEKLDACHDLVMLLHLLNELVSSQVPKEYLALLYSSRQQLMHSLPLEVAR